MSISVDIYTNLEKGVKENKAFIYKKKNQLPFEVIPFNNLFGAIEDIGALSLNESGIPDELINYIDMSMDAPEITYTDDKNMVSYYSPYENDTVEHVLSIIKLFNQLSSINISICVSAEIRSYVEKFSNANISFYSYEDPKELSITANKIITHGYSARSFIRQKIPTIIIGPYGLGGWVTPDNINYLLKDNFKGRPSGRYNEFVPLGILVDEFAEINDDTKLKKVLNENASIVDSYIKELNIDYKEDFIEKQNKLYIFFANKDKRWSLIPKLASNVRFVRDKGDTMVQRKKIEDVLFSLPESDLEFLEDLKSQITCKTLKEKYEMDDDTFWDIMTPLWERKAVIFSL